jgi:hypothetical protein
LIESRHELVLSKKEMLRKIPRNAGAHVRAHIPKTTDNSPAKDRDFGLAHTHGSVETARASGPAPGRTLHTKSGSTGAEGQLAKNLYEDNIFGWKAVKRSPWRVVGPFERATTPWGAQFKEG